MSRFFSYEPDQAYLLPPNIKDVLGKEHLCFHVHRVVEALDVSRFEQAYGAEGRLAYPPRMMLKVWLYAFCLRLTSTRRLEQRVREDLALRYLAGGLTPDHKTLSEFLRQHRRAINDVFTQVLELARRAGLVRLGHVAIDSTRVGANASGQRVLQGRTRRSRAAGAGSAAGAAFPAKGDATGSGGRRRSQCRPRGAAPPRATTGASRPRAAASA